MNVDLEADLLRLIDEFLQSKKDIEDYRRFVDGYLDEYMNRMHEPARLLTSSISPAVPAHEYPPEILDAIQTALEEQLPVERRALFDEIYQRMWLTVTGEVRPSARQYGYGSMNEFVRVVEATRDEYRDRFSV